jgi:hypothetical protein
LSVALPAHSLCGGPLGAVNYQLSRPTARPSPTHLDPSPLTRPPSFASRPEPPVHPELLTHRPSLCAPQLINMSTQSYASSQGRNLRLLLELKFTVLQAL